MVLTSRTMKVNGVNNSSLDDLILTWRDISYTIERKQSGNYLKDFLGLSENEFIQILNDVNGGIHSRKLMAVMGPSGAGKTTFLAAISLRVKGAVVGDVMINGEIVDRELLNNISGFVPQNDLAVESLTVQEHMEFMARMKMDRRYKSASRKQRVLILLTELGLAECCNSRLSSLSIGERKRVSLAVQLLTEPKILFCDEPTTGLDSYAAMTVVRILRDVADRGKIVICSLHQPASGLLDIFHEVLLLSSGRVAFQGDVSDAARFFDSLGLSCPPTFNSAEFFVSQLSMNRHKEMESRKKVNWICDKFEESTYGLKINDLMKSSKIMKDPLSEIPAIFRQTEVTSKNFKKVQSWTQLEWLTWRSYVDYKRNSSSHCLRAMSYMLIALLISTPYVGVTSKFDQGSIQNMQGLLYLVIIETVFTFSYAVYHTFPQELPFLLRDIAGGLYDPAPYYISKIAILTPGAILQPMIYAVVIYLITGLNGTFVDFLYFILPIVLCAISATAFGCLMSAAFKSVDTASMVSVPIEFLSLSFSGMYLHLGNVSSGLSWLRYVSQFYYGLEAISIVQWNQIDHIDCSSNPEVPCISNGLDVLAKYGYEPGHYYLDILGLLAVFWISHLVGFLALRHRSRKEPVY